MSDLDRFVLAKFEFGLRLKEKALLPPFKGSTVLAGLPLA